MRLYFQAMVGYADMSGLLMFLRLVKQEVHCNAAYPRLHLVLEAGRTYLALHHQFDSVDAAIRDGVDIIPSVTNVRVFDKPQRTAAHRARG